MSSSVFYKFKSRKDESRVNFEGTGISVFDLKKEIIVANNLGKANDFDLVILDGPANEGASVYTLRSYFHSSRDTAEYKDDAYIIPRSSSVVVKRVYAKPGKGKAAYYLGTAGPAPADGSKSSTTGSGAGGAQGWHRGNITKRFDGKEEPTRPDSAKPTATGGPVCTLPLLVFEHAHLRCVFRLGCCPEQYHRRRRGCCHGGDVPTAVRQLGRDPGEDVSVSIVES